MYFQLIQVGSSFLATSYYFNFNVYCYNPSYYHYLNRYMH